MHRRSISAKSEDCVYRPSSVRRLSRKSRWPSNRSASSQVRLVSCEQALLLAGEGVRTQFLPLHRLPQLASIHQGAACASPRVPSVSSPKPPRALARFALSLFSFPFPQGALALPLRAEPLTGLARPCLDPGDLLEQARLLHANHHRPGHLGRHFQVRPGEGEVLLQRGDGFSRSFRSVPSAPHSLVTTSRCSLCPLYTSTNAFASPDAFSASSARRLVAPTPPFKAALMSAIRSRVIPSARFPDRPKRRAPLPRSR